MISVSHGNKDLDCFFITCFPQDIQFSKYKLQIGDIFDFFKSVKANSLIFRKTNTIVFIPYIEADIGALLFSYVSKAKKEDLPVLAKNCFGIKYNCKVAICCQLNFEHLTDLLLKKYVPNRVHYMIRYKDLIEDAKLSKIIEEGEKTNTDETPEEEISVQRDWQSVHEILKAQNKGFDKNKKSRPFEDCPTKDFSEVKAYFKFVQVVQYANRKQHPSVYNAEKSDFAYAEKGQVRKSATVPDSASGKKDNIHFAIPKISYRKRKRQKSDYEYRKSCPDFGAWKMQCDTELDQESIFSDPENFGSLTDIEKEISLRKCVTEDGELKPHVRKHLSEITNLPFSLRSLRHETVVVFPGGRKKKYDRQSERRQQRQGQVIVQPTEDDAPESMYNLPRDRIVLPTQPEQRNLQHLVPSFTPRVEPISASTQQLRRLSSRPRHQQYADESARQQSFADWPSNTGQNPENMVTNGFFYTGRLDLIRCFMCGIGLKDWSADDEPLFEHIRHSPDCPFLYAFLGQDVLDAYKAALLPGRARPAGARDGSQGNQGASNVEGASLTPAGGTPVPRNPEYEDLRQRLDSYSNWPRTITQTPRQLAEAGFYHTGEGDTVRCFHCDGGLRRWDPRDDPWIEHTRWFPHCPYVRQIKGLDYVELVQRAIRESAGQDDEDDDPPADYGGIVGAMANLEVQPPSSEPEVPPVTPQTILDMGYTREAVTEAMKTAEDRGMVNYSVQDLLEILLDKEPKPNTQGAQEIQGASSADKGASSADKEDDPLFVQIENRGLRKVLKCSECKIRDKNILFLPCTHHSLCEQCADKTTKCPVCNSDIHRKVKTYMS